MGLFDNARKLIQRIFNPKPVPKSPEPEIPKGIDSAWAKAEPPKPSFFERVSARARSLFNPPKAKKAPEPASKPAPMPQATQQEPFKAPPTPRHFRESDTSKRQEEIFRFRRNSQEEGNAFYRLTQSIWDDPNIPSSKRDEAIKDYFSRKYGLNDMNEIYDFVLEQNRDIVERYRNSPNALKYEILKNMRIENAEL